VGNICGSATCDVCVQVAAEDGGTPRRSGTMLVDVVITDVNDNSPRFRSTLYNAEITENAPPQRSVVVVTYVVLAVYP